MTFSEGLNEVMAFMANVNIFPLFPLEMFFTVTFFYD